MGFMSDFKAFAMRGNVLDLAVGVIIGGAFGKIVTAAVDDIIMPIVGLITGGKKFDDNYVVLSTAHSKITEFTNVTLEDAKKAGASVFAWGHMLQTILDFLIVAFFIFMVVRAVARMHKKTQAEAMAPAPTPSENLLTEIRDLLKKQA